jgi:hypothetical protein
MRDKVLFALLLLAVAGLFARGQLQQTEIDELAAKLEQLQAAAPPLEEDDGIAPSTVQALAGHRPARMGEAEAAAGSGARVAAVELEAPAGEPAHWTKRSPEAVHDELLRILDSDNPEVRGRVREMVEAAEESLRDERRERRQERWEARSLERLAQLGHDVSLTQHQQDALFAILTVARDRAAEAFRAGREKGDFEQAREQARKARDEANAEARELLDDKQYKAFADMLEEERPGGRRRQRAR